MPDRALNPQKHLETSADQNQVGQGRLVFSIKTNGLAAGLAAGLASACVKTTDPPDIHRDIYRDSRLTEELTVTNRFKRIAKMLQVRLFMLCPDNRNDIKASRFSQPFLFLQPCQSNASQTLLLAMIDRF